MVLCEKKFCAKLMIIRGRLWWFERVLFGYYRYPYQININNIHLSASTPNNFAVWLSFALKSLSSLEFYNQLLGELYIPQNSRITIINWLLSSDFQSTVIAAVRNNFRAKYMERCQNHENSSMLYCKVINSWRKICVSHYNMCRTSPTNCNLLINLLIEKE